MANAQRNQKQNFWYDLVLRLNLPIDPSSLAILRMLFGICMFLDTLQERGLLFAEKRFGDPLLCTFSCFNLAPLSVNGFYFMLGAMLTTSFNIFIGFFYRISTLVFSFCYWYLFVQKCCCFCFLGKKITGNTLGFPCCHNPRHD